MLAYLLSAETSWSGTGKEKIHTPSNYSRANFFQNTKLKVENLQLCEI